MIKLIGTDGQRLYRFELEVGTYSLGRNSQQDLHIPDSTVSRNHATIEINESGKVYIIDNGSYNGTTVNDVRIDGRREVNIGDRIGFGRTNFKAAPETETG